METMIRVFYGGVSYELPLETLDVPVTASDAEILDGVAGGLAYRTGSVVDLAGFVVDRRNTPNLVVRPTETWGM